MNKQEGRLLAARLGIRGNELCGARLGIQIHLKFVRVRAHGDGVGFQLLVFAEAIDDVVSEDAAFEQEVFVCLQHFQDIGQGAGDDGRAAGMLVEIVIGRVAGGRSDCGCHPARP